MSDSGRILASNSALKTVRAKEISESQVLQNLAKGSNLAEGSKLPPGASVDFETGYLRWQTDIQDIGQTFSGTVSVLGDQKSSSANYSIMVAAPLIEKIACGRVPEVVIGDVKPELKWHWKGVGEHRITFSSPVAGDLDNDGSTEIVTTVSNLNYSNVNGPLMVLKGNSGEVIWNSLQESNISVEVSTTPALMDLDGDGSVEIIVVSINGSKRRLNIISPKEKKVVKFFEDGFICGSFCMAAVGDIDGDGKPEISAGNVILNSDGSLKHFLIPTPGHSSSAATTTLAELDSNSPGMEAIVNGSQVYSNSGKFLWKGDCIGFSAVGDLDNNGKNELVCSGSGSFSLYSSSGEMLWKKPIVGGGNGGAPNIGSFLKNQGFQIGLAGGSNYVVHDIKGNLIWSTPTQDHSSSSTGSTIFDFNGDGKVEVVYNDETHLRIYDGSTGSVLWSTPNLSGTLWEYPLIVDIDNDKSADIIVPAPGWHAEDDRSIGQGGVKAFGDPTKKWVSTRNLWNQYSYCPEAVSDKLQAIGSTGVPKSGFRVNVQGSLKAEGRILLADLDIVTPLFPDASTKELSFYLTNKGEAPSEAHKTIRLLHEASGEILGSLLVKESIKSGEGLLVKLQLGGKKFEATDRLIVDVNMDSQSELTSLECEIENNRKIFALLGADRNSWKLPNR